MIKKLISSLEDTFLSGEKEKEKRKALTKEAQTYLDCGFGECILKNPAFASIVLKAIIKDDKVLYKVLA